MHFFSGCSCLCCQAQDYQHQILFLKNEGEQGRIHLEILGGGVSPCSPNPDPSSYQKMAFSTPILRPGIGRNYVNIT